MDILPIPEGFTRGWKVFVRAGGVVEISSKFGTLKYGLRPEGYDGWAFYGIGGGGSVTIPYARNKGELFIGLVNENRPNISHDPVLCAIGGFLDPKETHESAQRREASEEVGINTLKARKLTGVPTCPDRGFFVCNVDKDEGVHSYALEIPFEWLAPQGNGFTLNPEHLLGVKRESDVIFYHWRTAIALTPDGLARAAIAQLLSEVL